MRILSLIAVVLFVSSLAAPALAGMKEDCVQAYDRDLQIGSQTPAIFPGAVSSVILGTGSKSDRGRVELRVNFSR